MSPYIAYYFHFQNTTHGRGLALTDADGVAYFETNFPGHYTGRAPHIHVLTTLNATLLPNNTISGGTVSHIGQVITMASAGRVIFLTYTKIY